MGLRAFLNHRRNQRLGWALFAALMVHVGAVFTGNWGILLNSTPSNQDRTLTLTLESTPYEGLKETSQDEEDTIDDAKLGQAQEAPQDTETTIDPQADAVKPSVTSKQLEQIAEVEPEPVVAQELILEEPLAEQEPLAKEKSEPEELIKGKEVAVDNEAEPHPLSKPLEAKERSSDSSANYIAANEPSSIKLKTQAPREDQDPLNDALESNDLDATERKMLNRKARSWASSFSKSIETPEPLVWEEAGNEYVANFEKYPAENDMDTDEVVIEIATNRDGKKLTTSLRLKKMAFSNFAQFVHQWDDNVSVHDDEMNGRFHSNTKINLVADRDGAPLFHGKVTTASFFVDIEGRVPRKKIFLAGLETGVKRIAMPKPSLLFSQAHEDANIQSMLIEQSSRIIFSSDGSYFLQAHKEVGVMQRHEIGDDPLYILAAPGVSLSLSGTVNGAVAVYSPKRLIIEGDLEYASIEHIDDGGDFLGLISERSVVIANRKSMPLGDLNIQAAIYAKNRFEVKQVNGKQSGTLNILGSVSAGTITATQPRYATNIVFDTRLEKLRPPGFPVTDRYEVLAKNNNWQLHDDPFYENADQEAYDQPSTNLDSIGDIK